MSHKVTWKKGMRLTTELFDASDDAVESKVRLASLIASGGRQGLFPTAQPFELSVCVSGNILEVVSLNCHGVTRSGLPADVCFDSEVVSTVDTRVTIPTVADGESLILLLKIHDHEWIESSNPYSERAYSFALVSENTPLDDDVLPIGMMINQYGWRLNETDFLPPCLYISAHPKYVALWERIRRLCSSIVEKCEGATDCIAVQVVSNMWRTASEETIRLDKERNLLAPEHLVASLQNMVQAFIIGCALDNYVSIENPEPYVNYVRAPYDSRHICREIERGLELCEEIAIKFGTVCSITETLETPPSRTAPQKPVKPTPAPPVRPSRHGWEGLEI